jgi:hypothetical protein
MTKKQPHIAETKTPKPNRAQRRHPEKTDDSPPTPKPEANDDVVEQDVPPVQNTADTWNQ